MKLKNVLFIGCGGSAGRIVSLLKERLSREEKSNNLYYLVYDLEHKHVTGYDNLNTDEYCFFGGVNPREFVSGIIKRGASSTDYLELNKYFPVDLPQFLDMLPDRRVEKGAGRKRMVGRLLAYANKAEIKRAFDKQFRKLQKTHQSINPNVVVISSCCGGTGSSVFYDILNLSAAKSINLFPVVIGPSSLVRENETMLYELGEKIRMNAFAFFEEFSVYNNFPNQNFSFFSTPSTRLNLPFFYFFDNLLHESEEIATENYEFETYMANCLTHVFRDSTVNLDEWQTEAEIKQSFGSTLENVLDDVLNQPRRVPSEVFEDHREKANFISFSYFETPNRDLYLSEILQALIGEDGNLSADKLLAVNDLIKAIDPQKNSNTIKVPVQNEGDSILQKYVEPFTESKATGANLGDEKVLRLTTIADYLKTINSHIITGGASSNSSQSSGNSYKAGNSQNGNYQNTSAKPGFLKKFWANIRPLFRNKNGNSVSRPQENPETESSEELF